MAEGILGIRKFNTAFDEIGLPQNNARMKRPRNSYEPVLGQIQEFPYSPTNYALPDVDLALQIVATILANPQSQAQNIQYLLSFLPETPNVQKIVANCPLSNEQNDPRLPLSNPKDPELTTNITKDPRLSCSKPNDPRLFCDRATLTDPRILTCNKLDDPRAYNNEMKDAKPSCIDRESLRRIDEQKRMFAAKKLSLVLDLDHTLLHSIGFANLDPANEAILRKNEEIDRNNPRRHLFRFAKLRTWTKLRPGVWNFLEKASKLFTLHVNTMGNKSYATEMVKILDPTGSLFGMRVTSRGEVVRIDDDERIPKTKNLEKVFGLESAALIIDDTSEVWPNNQQNLIQAEMYRYFPCSSKSKFGVDGPSLFEIGQDERPEDGTLSSLLQVIERIHSKFFSSARQDKADVKSILSDEKRLILQGCKICFSRVIPMKEANPHLHPLWKRAEQFGATCTNQIDEHVTHVVANSFETEKVNWALLKGRFVVNPSWVDASALLFRRANEQQFALEIT